MSEQPEYRLERVFQAPRDLVWRAWTEPELLSRWYGPGVETTIHGFDLAPGGSWLNEMKWGETSNYQRMQFQEVTPVERLVWHHSSTDADWNVVANPMMPGWPKVLVTTVTFEARGDETHVAFTQVPLDATDEEVAFFVETMNGMDGGWGKGFEIIDEIVAELAAG